MTGEIVAAEWRSLRRIRMVRFAAFVLALGMLGAAPLLFFLIQDIGLDEIDLTAVSVLALVCMSAAPAIVSPIIVYRVLTPSLNERLEHLWLTPSGAVPLLGARLLVRACAMTILYVLVGIVASVGLFHGSESEGDRIIVAVLPELFLGSLVNVLVLANSRLGGWSWQRVFMTWGPLLFPLHVLAAALIPMLVGFEIIQSDGDFVILEGCSAVVRIPLIWWALRRLPASCEAYIRREVIGDFEA